MTKSLVRVAALVLLILAASAPHALAQSYISPFLGFNFGGDSNCQSASACEDTMSNYGVALGSGAFIAFEEELFVARDFFGKDPSAATNVLTLMSNLVAGPRLGVVRPYVILGFGFIRTRSTLRLSDFASGDTTLGWTVGGGLELSKGHVGVRADVRRVRGLQALNIPGLPVSGSSLDFNRASVGLLLRF